MWNRKLLLSTIVASTFDLGIGTAKTVGQLDAQLWLLRISQNRGVTLASSNCAVGKVSRPRGASA